MRLRGGHVISGAWLVHVLSRRGPVHRCDECGSPMFVRAPSGLCPVCFTRRSLREREVHDIAFGEVRGAVAEEWVADA